MTPRVEKFISNFSSLLMCLLLGVATVAWASEDDGEYVGYLRVGAGSSLSGGSQNCYYLGSGTGNGYRLGNECNSYTEFGYAKTFAKAEDGVKFVGHIMVTDYSADSAYSGNLQISQIFVDVNGLDWMHGGKVWAGDRYYERPDIHWMDLQYINLNGTGAGFDNYGVSAINGKLSYAVFKDNDTNSYSGTNLGSAYISSNSAIRNNFIYRGLPENGDDTLHVVLGVILPSSPSSDRHAGYYANAFYNRDFLGGDNTLGIQYGVGPGTGRGDPASAFSAAAPYLAFSGNAPCCNRMGPSGSTLLGGDDTRLRVFDALWIQPTSKFGAGFDLVYQSDKSPVYGGSSNWDSVGFRPEYAFARHFKLQGEIGVDHVDYPGAPSENLIKYTIAPTLTLGQGFFDRPEIRFFVTRANWNGDAAATINYNNNKSYALGTATTDTSVGIQLEAWWGKNWF